MKSLMKFAIGLLCVGLCVGIFVSCNTEQKNIQYDEREFRMLLEENELLYEQNLRIEHHVPEDISVKEYLSESYSKEMQKQNEKYIARRRAVQSLAEKYCGIEPLNYDELQALMEKENASRAKKIAEGEVVYGVTEFDFAQFLVYYWDQLENAVLNQMMKEEKSDKKELEEFYHMMEEPLYTDGESVSYYLYSSEEQLDLENQQSYSKEPMEMNFEEIRQYVREYGIGEDVFLNFDKNQVHYLKNEDGKNFYIQFEAIQKDTELSEDELSIIQSRITRQRYEEELNTFMEEQDL